MKHQTNLLMSSMPHRAERVLTILNFLLILALIRSHDVFASLTGKVIGVSDGDTITVLTDQREQIKIRLFGIDAPEKSQDYGQKAKDFTASIVAGKEVIIEPVDTDRYGRTVGLVSVNGSNLNEQIVTNGYGWVYRKYCHRAFCDDWLKLETKAREARLGLWQNRSPV